MLDYVVGIRLLEPRTTAQNFESKILFPFIICRYPLLCKIMPTLSDVHRKTTFGRFAYATSCCRSTISVVGFGFDKRV
jgi:hypothetical protein